ncbi:YfhO family protein [Haloplasma contractile]|uniref:Membrane YfhO protein n=1 Tax=Haloplasma contractile SSD-17B TaxID=1033810 RepID=U2EAA5_9MOLU|nr:YfhO family protein [Haloplasma contractile]ERJ12023.1 membrane YfhO protein [Haloplasma contractile SSD-17B]
MIKDKLLTVCTRTRVLTTKFLNHRFTRKVNEIFFTTHSYKKTLFLALFYVFLFYLPFTFMTFFLDHVVFFQLDHLYQFSNLIFDLKSRLLDFNFSTWDHKNALGYDYFANFYYIPLDFSTLPFLVLPFLANHKLLWLSFLIKILAGTAIFSYLLKLYKLSFKTILITSILYGSADLFFSQNVFPTFTGLIFYIPLLLVSIEFIIQKKNFWFFSLTIFQLFLFNFYWAWPLTLFMALSMLVRYVLAFIVLPRRANYKYFTLCLIKSILFYLIGLGMASFFILPILNIMSNEPRMNELIEINRENMWEVLFKFDTMVYLKTFFKMLVPNLFAYSGFFYDDTDSYWLPTNHIIIYSSIMSSFTLLHFIIVPSSVIKKKIKRANYKIYTVLRVVTLLTTVMLFIPGIAFVFSATTTAYLRWFVFYGTLLIINFAFLFEYKLINRYLLSLFMLASAGYIWFALEFNGNQGPSTFHNTDATISKVSIVIYLIIAIWLMIYRKRMNVSLTVTLFIEKVALMILIFALCVSSGYSSGVLHNSKYAGVTKELLRRNQGQSELTLTHDFLYYNEKRDLHPLRNMPYTFESNNVYGNYNVFHSLINPYFTFYHRNSNHSRSYNVMNVPYFYYRFTEPTQFLLSTNNDSPVHHFTYTPGSALVDSQQVDDFNSTVSLYRTGTDLSLGSGFTTYYSEDDGNKHAYLWLKSAYVQDEDVIENLLKLGIDYNDKTDNILMYRSYNQTSIKEYDFEHYYSPYKFSEIEFELDADESEALIVKYSSASSKSVKGLFIIDQNDDLYRCYNRFCHVPENGIKKVIVGYKKSNEHFNPKVIDLYTVKQSKLEKQMLQLKKYSTYDVDIDGNTITSKVINDQPLIMVYRIGYAKGWNVYVDGKKVESFPAHEGMLGFTLESTGEHEITMKYETPGLRNGIFISTGSFLIFGLLVYSWLKNKNKGAIVDEINT